MTNKQQQAENYFTNGNYQQALALYQDLSQSDHHNDRWYYHIALCQQRCNNGDAAAQALQKATHHAPQNPLYPCLLGALLNHQSRHHEAEGYYQQALSLSPDDPSILLSLGLCHFHQDQFQPALSLFQQAQLIAPDNANILFHHALAHCKLDQHAEAITLLEQAIEHAPDHEQSLGQLGEIHLTLKHYKKACDYFSARLQINDRHAETWHSMGQAELKLGLFQEAITSLEHCIAINHRHPLAHHDLANALVHEGNHPKALSHYFRQIEIDPLAETFYNIGVLLMHQEHNKDAILYLEKALELNPDNSDGHINLANIYLKQERFDDALRHYQQAYRHKPEDEELQHIISALTETNTSQRAPNGYLSNLFNQYAPYYDQHLTKQLRYNAPQALRLLIEEHYAFDHCQEIIDLGCGTGLVAEALQPMTKTIIGIDVASDMISAAKEKQIYQALYENDIEQVLPTLASASLIVAADVLSYFGDLSPLLTLCHNNLKDNGLLAFTVEKGTRPGYFLQKTLRYCHHPDYLESTLAKQSFQLIELTPIILREQHRQPVHGFAILAKKNQR